MSIFMQVFMYNKYHNSESLEHVLLEVEWVENEILIV